MCTVHPNGVPVWASQGCLEEVHLTSWPLKGREKGSLSPQCCWTLEEALKGLKGLKDPVTGSPPKSSGAQRLDARGLEPEEGNVLLWCSEIYGDTGVQQSTVFGPVAPSP
ncbi:hypothetical protein AAFF_G00206940 [Aldrovandia affinis]|uniref:Uncharacterized protein n=1 Tax=Aldrovandia affinis TaxID=143900 RepID=A0AAD7RH53_9TELE|nr:hypothetical protein AAFF_G00206940 [Aldrovandia affinis]